MTAYQWIFLIGFCTSFLACVYQFISVLFLKKPREYAKSKGKVIPAIGYSLTKAMMPSRKETAYLHLPTYVSGLVYHLGTFLSFFIVFLVFFGYFPSTCWSIIIASLLVFAFLGGLFILIKRIIRRDLHLISNADDYISNFLVTFFQGFVAVTLLINSFAPALLVYTTFLMLYIPIGKLKHVVYFFTSRIYLAVFYGSRGVWPVRDKEA